MTATTYNLSIGGGAAAIVAGVAMLAGAAWALIAAGSLTLTLTLATLAMMRRR